MSRVRLGNAFPLPFAIPTVGSGDVGFETLYPIGFSRADIIKFWWRVRTWSFTGLVYPADWDGTGEPSVSVTVSSTLQDSDGDAISDEKGLLTAAGVNLIAAGSGDVTENEVTLGFMVDGFGGQCVQTGGLYYPFILGGDGGGGDSVSAGFGFTFNGVAYGGPETHPERRVLTIGDYWPYTGADSTAIYDTTSGAALVDPVSAPYP